MSALITTALIYSATPSAVATIAVAGATIWEPPPAVRSALLHLAAGVVFAVVAAELLPQIMKEEGALPWTVAGFIPGVLIMLLVRWLNHQADSKASEGNQWPMALLAGDTIDQTVGGVLLGVSLTTGTTIGALLSLSMGVEDVSFGVAITLTLAKVGAVLTMLTGQQA